MKTPLEIARQVLADRADEKGLEHKAVCITMGDYDDSPKMKIAIAAAKIAYAESRQVLDEIRLVIDKQQAREEAVATVERIRGKRHVSDDLRDWLEQPALTRFVIPRDPTEIVRTQRGGDFCEHVFVQRHTATTKRCIKCKKRFGIDGGELS